MIHFRKLSIEKILYRTVYENVGKCYMDILTQYVKATSYFPLYRIFISYVSISA